MYIDVEQLRSWAVSSGSTLFAKACWYRLWQWKSHLMITNIYVTYGSRSNTYWSSACFCCLQRAEGQMKTIMSVQKWFWPWVSKLCMLDKKFSRRHSEIFLISRRKQILTFHAFMLRLSGIIWLKCQILFSGKIRKYLSSAEFALRVVIVQSDTFRVGTMYQTQSWTLLEFDAPWKPFSWSLFDLYYEKVRHHFIQITIEPQ